MKKRLTPADLDAMISSYEIIRPTHSTLTLCVMVLTNGCTIVGQSNVIDSENYDERIGEQAAYNNAREQIWQLEGYAMKRDMKRLPEIAARVAHEMNRMYCATKGDLTQSPWDFAPEWQKDSAVVGALAVRDNPNLEPADSHEGWMQHKLDEGWKWGPVKDEENKTHPCLVPYHELPDGQRYKDKLFTTVCKAVMAE